MPFYTRAREEHWLRDKQEEGKIVILEDESVWEVHPSDRPVTTRWLPDFDHYREPTPKKKTIPTC